MALPSSIWVKFKDDQIKVTYLGVEYTLTYDSPDGEYGFWSTTPVSGTMSDGFRLVIGRSSLAELSPGEQYIQLNEMVGGGVGDATTIGTITISLSYTATFTGTDITAASIIHRDSRLPKLLELPYDDGTHYELHVNSTLGDPLFQIELWTDDVFYVGLGDGESSVDYSLVWNSEDNIGTTDCPFVEWIGELTENNSVELFDTNEVIFSTGGKPSKRNVTNPEVVSNVRVNTDIEMQ